MIKTISLFSGCGGFDFGHDVVFAIDNDKFAVQTYNANFKTQAVCADIRNFTEFPEADCVIGGFPCQKYSLLPLRKGEKAKGDDLYKEMVRVIDTVKPKVFLMENVTNIKKFLPDMEFPSDYIVSWRILNAQDFGVPQHRNRLFIVGLRADSVSNPIAVFPVGTHRHVTCKEAIDDLVNRTDHVYTKRARTSYKIANRNLDPDKPSPILLADLHGTPWHYALERRISTREAARLHSYPDSFVWPCSMTQTYKQIGNSVPPLLSKALAAFCVSCIN